MVQWTCFESYVLHSSGYDQVQRIQTDLGKRLCSCLGRHGLKFSVNWNLCFGTQWKVVFQSFVKYSEKLLLSHSHMSHVNRKTVKFTGDRESIIFACLALFQIQKLHILTKSLLELKHFGEPSWTVLMNINDKIIIEQQDILSKSGQRNF